MTAASGATLRQPQQAGTSGNAWLDKVCWLQLGDPRRVPDEADQVLTTSGDLLRQSRPFDRAQTVHRRPSWNAAGGVVLVLVALWLLVGGRWASYVGIPAHGLYATDAATGIGLLLVGIGGIRRPRSLLLVLDAPWAVRLAGILCVYAAIRLAVAGIPSHLALRDAAPYLYAITAVAVYLARLGQGRRWSSITAVALVAHAAWVSAALASPAVATHWHLYGDVYAFQTRSDFDIAVCGIAAALSLMAARRSRPLMSAMALVFAGWNAWLASIMWSRAGLLAALVACFAAVSIGRRQGVSGKSRRHATTAMIVLALLLAAAAVLFTSAGKRATDLITSPGGASAGTVEGRGQAWSRVADYTTANPARTAAGVGFGPDFLAASGGLRPLGGDPTLRSPHDYELGTFARLGVPGLLLTTLLTLAGFRLAWLSLRRDSPTGVQLSGLILIVMPIIAAFGVVFEAPFGAIPYFVAAGYAASWFTLRGHDLPAVHRPRSAAA